MSLIRCPGCRHRARAAEPLKLRRDLRVIQVGMVTATRADELERTDVAAFHPARYDAGRPAPQARRPAMAGLASKRKCHDALGTDAQPRVMWFRPTTRLPALTRTGSPEWHRISGVKGQRPAHHLSRSPSWWARVTAWLRVLAPSLR
jgi:hypothetical protein